MTVDLFAGVPVSDHERALDRYGRLFGSGLDARVAATSVRATGVRMRAVIRDAVTAPSRISGSYPGSSPGWCRHEPARR